LIMLIEVAESEDPSLTIHVQQIMSK